MSAIRPRLVLIEWEDSAQPVAGWNWLEGSDWRQLVKCQTAGWLVYDGADVKAVAQSRGAIGGETQVSGVMRIPARAVTRIRRL